MLRNIHGMRSAAEAGDALFDRGILLGPLRPARAQRGRASRAAAPKLAAVEMSRSSRTTPTTGSMVAGV